MSDTPVYWLQNGQAAHNVVCDASIKKMTRRERFRQCSNSAAVIKENVSKLKQKSSANRTSAKSVGHHRCCSYGLVSLQAYRVCAGVSWSVDVRAYSGCVVQLPQLIKTLSRCHPR